ncbi:MAG: hypothetical protein IJ055_06190 [Oscillospiraceae bacterium]|nr:hypothetical protein [Oscillospiraceae bacterium]
MNELIASYEQQLSAIRDRLRQLHRQRRSCTGNLTYGQLTRRIEALETEEEEIEAAIGRMKGRE